MSQCDKKPYANRKEALAALKRHNENFTVSAKGVYRCPYLNHKGKFHITTMQAKKGRKQRAFHIKKANQ